MTISIRNASFKEQTLTDDDKIKNISRVALKVSVTASGILEHYNYEIKHSSGKIWTGVNTTKAGATTTLLNTTLNVAKNSNGEGTSGSISIKIVSRTTGKSTTGSKSPFALTPTPKFTITHHPNGGMGLAYTTTLLYGRSEILGVDSRFSRVGFTNIGYTAVSVGTTAITSVGPVTSNKTVYVLWQRNSYTLDVTPVCKDSKGTIHTLGNKVRSVKVPYGAFLTSYLTYEASTDNFNGFTFNSAKTTSFTNPPLEMPATNLSLYFVYDSKTVNFKIYNIPNDWDAYDTASFKYIDVLNTDYRSILEEILPESVVSARGYDIACLASTKPKDNHSNVFTPQEAYVDSKWSATIRSSDLRGTSFKRAYSEDDYILYVWFIYLISSLRLIDVTYDRISMAFSSPKYTEDDPQSWFADKQYVIDNSGSYGLINFTLDGDSSKFDKVEVSEVYPNDYHAEFIDLSEIMWTQLTFDNTTYLFKDNSGLYHIFVKNLPTSNVGMSISIYDVDGQKIQYNGGSIEAFLSYAETLLDYNKKSSILKIGGVADEEVPWWDPSDPMRHTYKPRKNNGTYSYKEVVCDWTIDMAADAIVPQSVEDTFVQTYIKKVDPLPSQNGGTSYRTFNNTVTQAWANDLANRLQENSNELSDEIRRFNY